MQSLTRKLLAPLHVFLGRLRYRTLFIVVASLLAADLVVPDFIPLIDEILLAIVTIVLSRLREPESESVIDITPTRKP